MRTLFLGLTLFFTLNLSAQEETTGPAIEFTAEVVDYGEIERGSDGIRTFEFTNTGNQPHHLKSVFILWLHYSQKTTNAYRPR